MNNTSVGTGSSNNVVDLTVEYWIQYVLFYFIVGIPGIIGNLTVLILIIRDKKLQTFFFTLLAGRALTLSLFSFECVIIGVYRTCRFYIPELYNVTRLECHFLHLLLYFTDSLSSMSMCVLACDRTLAILRPLNYHSYKVKHAMCVLSALALLVVFCKILTSYFGTVPFTQTILCVSLLSPAPQFWSDLNFFSNLIIIILGIILYITLFITVSLRTKRLSCANVSNDSAIDRIIRRQLQLLPVVKLLIFVNVFTVLSFNVIMLMSTYMEPNLSARLFIYGTYLAAIDRFLDPFILFWKSTELRRALRSVFGLKSQNKVNSTVQTKRSNVQTVQSFVKLLPVSIK